MKLRNPFRKKKLDPEVQVAYDKAFREAKLERAKRLGKEAGSKKPKSFLDKMAGVGENVLKSGMFSEPQSKRKSKAKSDISDAEELGNFLIGSPKKRKKRKKK